MLTIEKGRKGRHYKNIFMGIHRTTAIVTENQ
jgi:hypothetical protein